MRPRPATWTASLVSAAPVDAALSGEVYARETTFPEECTFLAHAGVIIRESLIRKISIR